MGGSTAEDVRLLSVTVKILDTAAWRRNWTCPNLVKTHLYRVIRRRRRSVMRRLQLQHDCDRATSVLRIGVARKSQLRSSRVAVVSAALVPTRPSKLLYRTTASDVGA